ncbi:MAG: protein-tyrosine-phosphatase, partial [Tannerellaceae bacterium]
MLERILFLLTSMTTFVGCTSINAPEIRTLCLRDEIGNYVIKWETDPEIRGVMKMYVSDDPNSFDMTQPAGSADMDEGV